MTWRLLLLILGLLSVATAGGPPVASARALPADSAALTVGQPQEAASCIREDAERTTFKVARDTSPVAILCDPFPDLPAAAVHELQASEQARGTPRHPVGRTARARAPPAMG